PYDVIHFNIGLHGWPPGRIPDGQYEPLLRRYVEILRHHWPKTRLVWASTTQITVQGKPSELDPVHNATIVQRNTIAARVMGEYKIPISDLHGLMADQLKLAAGDRFHWTAPGRSIQAKAVIDAVKQALARAAPPASSRP
ncbi:MAG: SGNH/GDSL hydrolase family protein, partial [Planctomycetes bacterium]|nr:SGNH/GDSL hydrolase family protein [Planctomycetota bacterium]